jgi:hypothetical protein
MGRQEQSMAQSSLIYIGIAGTVVALDRATRTEVWRSDLKGNDFVNVALFRMAICSPPPKANSSVSIHQPAASAARIR